MENLHTFAFEKMIPLTTELLPVSYGRNISPDNDIGSIAVATTLIDVGGEYTHESVRPKADCLE